MRGMRNHGELRSAAYEGSARTAPHYELVDVGPYPALLRNGTTSVAGEIYRIDEATLASLDRFEGHPHLFERIVITLDDGSVAQAYVYASRAQGMRISSGDYRASKPR